MKKLIFILVLGLLLIFSYFSTIAISLNKFHRAIYNNDEILIKETIDFLELKKNLKDNLNIIMMTELNKEKDNSQSLNILAAGLASKFTEIIIDSYATPAGISALIKDSDYKKLPQPNMLKSYVFIKDVSFVDLSHIYFVYEKDQNKIPIHFKRNGTSWKLSEFKITDDLLKKLKGK
jgi:hypothetical protein